MNHPQMLSNRIDAYLLQLRECLGELPPEEVTDILREIRGHILERAEANGELTEQRLVTILKSLGRPEEIAPLYQADAAVARAKVSLSPRVVMRGVQRWSRVSGWGLALFITGVAGYATAFALILCGIGKIIAPSQFGGWVGPHAFDIGVNHDPAARDVLGRWLVPIGLIGGPALVLGTTRVLRWTLRFARMRKPTAA